MPGFDPAAGEPHRKAPWMMIAPVVVGCQLALAVDGSAELPAPHHERVIQQTALFEILDQGRTGLVGVLALPGNQLRQRVVVIPSAMEELNEADAAFREPPGEQAVRGKRAGRPRLGSVHLENPVGLFREIREVGHRRLHPVRHLVLRDPRRDLPDRPTLPASSGSVFPGSRGSAGASRC